MATNRVQIKIWISPEVKADMDLLYKSNWAYKSKDDHGRWRVEMSQSKFWENIILEHLESDMCRSLIKGMRH